MDPHDVVSGDDEQFALLLARYCEELLAGGDVDPAADLALSPAMRLRLQHALDCLHRLRRHQPRTALDDAVTKIMESDGTLCDDMVGKQIGRFRVLRTLGSGGGGIVFLVFDPDLHRESALKVPHMAAMLTPDIRRRFLREARAAAQLDHANLVPVYEAGEADGMCFLVSAYCRGGNLSQWLKARTTPLPFHQAAELVAVLADAVQYVHEHGIYHRDIKPSNILVDAKVEHSRRECDPTREASGPHPPNDDLDFTPRLSDFGLAKLKDCDSGQTASGTLLGTPSYMAPEQIECRPDDICPRTDVYGLGAVLYELLTGRPPFKGANDAETLEHALYDVPVAPRRLRSHVPRDLEIICLKCLEKWPERRYASAAELAEELRRFLAGDSIRARPPGTAERLGKWIRRHPWTMVFGCFVCLTVLAMLCGWLYLQAMGRKHEATLADAARQRAEQEKTIRRDEQRLRQHRYADDIAQAWHSWQNRRHAVVANLLDNDLPASDPNEADDVRGFEWYFLSRLAHSQPRVMRHPACIVRVAFSPDGSTCASGHSDGAIVLWDATSGKRRGTLREHTFSLSSLDYSPDGQYLVSGSGRGDNDTRWGELLLWDMQTHKLLRSFPAHLGAINSVVFSPDGRTLAAAVNPKKGVDEIKIWAMPSMTLRHTIPFAHPKGASSVAFACNSRRIAIGHIDGKISLCDSVMGQILETRSARQNPIWSMACGRKDAVVVSCGYDGWVQLHSLEPSGPLLAQYRHEDRVWDVALSPDDRSAGSVSRSTLKVWDCTTQRERFSRPLRGPGRAVAFSPDGKTVAVGDEDGRLWMYDAFPTQGGGLPSKDAPPAAEALSWQGHRFGPLPREAWAVAFSPDGNSLASAGDDDTLRLWDPATGRLLKSVHAHQKLISCIAYSPDGKLLVTGSYDNQPNVKIWNAATLAKVADLPGHSKPVMALAFAPNGRALATAGRDRVLRLWDLTTGKDHQILPGDEIESLAFSPDGRVLALAGQGQTAFLWDMPEEKRIHTLPSHPFGHVAAAFSPDGKILATGDDEGTLRFFEVATGALRLRVRRHTAAINCLAFTPDGKTLASAGFDKQVKLWQTATGRELLTLPAHKDRVRWLAFSPNGDMLATAGHDGILKIYRADKSRPRR